MSLTCWILLAASALPLPQDTQKPSEDSPASVESYEHPLFAFRSGLWVNLHHILHAEGFHHPDFRSRGPMRRPTRIGQEWLPLTGLSPEEREAWDDCRGFYARHFSPRDLLFGENMIEIKDALSERRDGDLKGISLDAAHVAILEQAGEVYRKHWWERHVRNQREFLATLVPLLEDLSESLEEYLATYYANPWPEEPIVVDLSIHAGWAGAYTTITPNHITFASADERHQGLSGIETLFHEAGHVLVRNVHSRIVDLAKGQGREEPANLWHAIIFFLSGEAVRAASGDDSFVPYAEKFGLYERAPDMKSYRALLETHFRAYLEDEIELDVALERILEAL